MVTMIYRLSKSGNSNCRWLVVYTVVDQTPYQRLLDSGQLSEEQIEALNKTYTQLNPAQLKRDIEKKLFKLHLAYQHKGWDNFLDTNFDGPNSKKDTNPHIHSWSTKKEKKYQKKKEINDDYDELYLINI